eukprot:4727069-Pyramimonas_sp.AAC.1
MGHSPSVNCHAKRESTRRSQRNAVYAVQSTRRSSFAELEVVNSAARAIISPTRCKTHAGTIAMSAGCWLVHLRGRASPRVLARAAAS